MLINVDTYTNLVIKSNVCADRVYMGCSSHCIHAYCKLLSLLTTNSLNSFVGFYVTS